MIKLVEGLEQSHHRSLIELYEAVGWHVYARDEEGLLRAFKNSSYVVLALEGTDVIGAARSISDDVSIHYLQDILVRPDQQRRGIGRKLLSRVLDRYAHVRTHLLLTDNEERQAKFYESFSFKNSKTTSLNSFIRQA